MIEREKKTVVDARTWVGDSFSKRWGCQSQSHLDYLLSIVLASLPSGQLSLPGVISLCRATLKCHWVWPNSPQQNKTKQTLNQTKQKTIHSNQMRNLRFERNRLVSKTTQLVSSRLTILTYYTYLLYQFLSKAWDYRWVPMCVQVYMRVYIRIQCFKQLPHTPNVSLQLHPHQHIFLASF